VLRDTGTIGGAITRVPTSQFFSANTDILEN
jgi:hypothetical protein